jgi:hypothetical protein
MADSEIGLIGELAIQLGFVPMNLVDQMINEALEEQQQSFFALLDQLDDEGGEGETDSSSDIDPGFYQGSGDGSDIDPDFYQGDGDGSDVDPGFFRGPGSFE